VFTILNYMPHFTLTSVSLVFILIVFLLLILLLLFFFFFFFNDPATTEIYTLSLHDALPISEAHRERLRLAGSRPRQRDHDHRRRSEEHTSELQSHLNLVCRLLLEKKKKKKKKQLVVNKKRWRRDKDDTVNEINTKSMHINLGQ